MENLQKLQHQAEQALEHLREPLRIIAVHGCQGSRVNVRNEALKHFAQAVRAVMTYLQTYVSLTQGNLIIEEKELLHHCQKEGVISKDQLDDLLHALRDVPKIGHETHLEHVGVQIAQELPRYYKALKAIADYLAEHAPKK